MGPIVLLVGGSVLLFVALPAMILRVLGRRLERRIAAVYPPDQIVLKDLRAVTLGLQSKGVFQGRGNGALVLTPKVLWFSRAWPRADLRIPLDAITEVTTVRSHLGKTYFRDLLRVSFRTRDTTDAVAWYVTDLAGWRAKLAELSA
jgi:hypothetical protein